MNKHKPIFITGTSRSGSTLLCKLLNVNKNVLIASDPYLLLFRLLRNAIVQNKFQNIEKFDPKTPLQDYYFDSLNLDILDAIQNSNLNIEVDKNEFFGILESAIARANFECPDIASKMDSLYDSNYGSLFDNALSLIAKLRNAENKIFVGFKDVWIIEFFSLLAAQYIDAKFIVIIRDPRGSISSMLNMNDTSQIAHPLSFARHWRKQVAFLLKYQNDPLLKDRIYFIKYEKLVSDPKVEVQRLCEFLKIEYSEEMINTENFSDNSGNTWSGNSTFESNTSGFVSKRAETWKTKLDHKVIKLVELVCGLEMKLLGYGLVNDIKYLLNDSEILEYIIQINGQKYNWRSDFEDPQKDYSFEIFRHILLKLPEDCFDNSLVRRSFLFKDVFNKLKKVV